MRFQLPEMPLFSAWGLPVCLSRCEGKLQLNLPVEVRTLDEIVAHAEHLISVGWYRTSRFQSYSSWKWFAG